MDIVHEIQTSFPAVYEDLPIPVFLFDQTAKLLNANRAFLALTGRNRNEIRRVSVGTLCTDLEICFEGDRVFKAVQDHYPTTLVHADGSRIPIELNHTKLKATDGTVRGCLAYVKDLRPARDLQQTTQELRVENAALRDQLEGRPPDKNLQKQKKLEQDITTAMEFLESIIESSGDGMVIVDASGRIGRVNESFARIVGKNKKDITGRLLHEMGPREGSFSVTTGENITLDRSYTDYLTNRLEAFMKLADGAKIEHWEFYAFHQSGHIVPLELTVSMQKDEQGILTGAVCSARDITEKKKAEKALREAHLVRNRFVTNITHEFRTPLTLAIGPLEEILRGECGPVNHDTRNHISVALQNSRRLLKLVNQLLDFSMLGSGSQNLLYESKDLPKFIGAVLESFSRVAEKKHIELSLHTPGDMPPMLIDSVKLEKALFNILGNAFKFTPENGRITVTVAQDSRQEQTPQGPLVTISVADTGIGIKKQDLAHIFDRFRQGGNSINKYEGSGIGLAHTRELMEVMGGAITAESTPGAGSTFSLHLPCRRTDKAEKNREHENREDLYLQPEIELADIHTEKKSLVKSISGKKPLILIVDDNPAIRRYVAAIIRKEYDFIEARNGVDALRKLDRHRPDLILCDIMMPEMDGYEFLRRIRASDTFQNTAFIFLTARADTEMKVEGLEEGADDYIVKPFNSLELIARVKSLLRIRTLTMKTAAQQETIDTLTRKLQEKFYYGNIVGKSPAMRKIYQLLDTIKDNDSTVLIMGETGTGKELIANSIHYNSPRSNGPMVSVNCGAIPKDLMEREFFGHVKGAYTGAVESRNGYFQEADGGTLFLDEIGEMDKDMQVKLLRVLERGEVVRLGDSSPRKVDVRLIAATNKDLRAEMQRGTFREDLFYRIYVIPLQVPPLRSRQEDIALLITHFMNRYREKNGGELPRISESDMRRFMHYDFPGNVRELEHMVERYCLLGGATDDLFSDVAGNAASGETQTDYSAFLSEAQPLKKAAASAESDIIRHTLGLHDNDYAQTAKELKIGLSSLYRKIKEYGLGPT